MFKRERRERPPCENTKKLTDLQAKRLEIVNGTSEDKCYTLDYDYFNSPDKETFDFVYCQNAADRLTNHADTFFRDVYYSSPFKRLGYYKELIDSILIDIQSLRGIIKENYGDAKHSRRSPYLSQTTLHHEKKFSDGIRNEYSSQFAIIQDDLERAADGRTNPDIARMFAKKIEDELREDYNLYISLKKDIESGSIKSKDDLTEVLKGISDSAHKVSSRAHEKRDEARNKRTDEDDRRAAARRAAEQQTAREKRSAEPKQETPSSNQRSSQTSSGPKESPQRRESVVSKEPIFFIELGLTLAEYFNSKPEDFEKLMKGKYRKLAMDNHPDRHPDKIDAEDKMKRINEAFSTLSDPASRDKYLAFWRQGRKK